MFISFFMRYSQSSCSGLFICTAILCWNNNHHHSFFNITNCTPKSIHLFRNNNNSSIICSNCTRGNFIPYHCDKQIIKIQFENSCPSSFQYCQCFPSNQPNWMKALIKPGKSHLNINRVNNINQSALSFVYILVGFILLLGILGGMIGIIFHWIKFQSCQQQTLK